MGNCCVLFHRQVRVAFIKEDVLANQIGFRKSFFDISEFERHFLVDIPDVAVGVNSRLFDHHRLFDRRNGVEWLVFNFDQVHCIESDVLINRCDRSYRITNEANLVDTKSVFVLANRKDAV